MSIIDATRRAVQKKSRAKRATSRPRVDFAHPSRHVIVMDAKRYSALMADDGGAAAEKLAAVLRTRHKA